MKKKFLIGIGILVGCAAFVVTITKVNLNLNDESGLQISNIEAYASDSEGSKWKCYGPKPDNHCLCENDVECKDLHGCR